MRGPEAGPVFSWTSCWRWSTPRRPWAWSCGPSWVLEWWIFPSCQRLPSRARGSACREPWRCARCQSVRSRSLPIWNKGKFKPLWVEDGWHEVLRTLSLKILTPGQPLFYPNLQKMSKLFVLARYPSGMRGNLNHGGLRRMAIMRCLGILAMRL